MQIHLEIDDVSVPMNPFVQKIFNNTLLGLISSLEGIPVDPERITITLLKEGKKDEQKKSGPFWLYNLLTYRWLAASGEKVLIFLLTRSTPVVKSYYACSK